MGLPIDRDWSLIMATTFETIGYNSDDGSIWGLTSSDPIAVYGKTPATRYGTVLTPSTFTITTAITSNAAGFASAAALSTFVGQVSSILVVLERFGLTTST